MRKRGWMTAALLLAVSLTACAPKTEETKPETTIEETMQEMTSEAVPEGTEGAEETKEAETAASKLDEIHEAVQSAYGEDYIPNMAFDADMLKEQYGIEPDWYDSFIAEGPMISANVETFIGVEAKEGKAEAVAKALSAYRDSQLTAGIQYPINLPKLEASEVVSHGNYVFFVMLGTPDMEAEEQGEEAALASAKEKNQIGMDVIDSFFTE